MSAKYFLDTNIFVYSFDQSQPQKQAKALALIAEALQTGRGMVSTQVIQEFLNVALRKFPVPMKPEDGKTYLQKVLLPICQVSPDQALYEAALDILQQTGYAFYDALILAGAQRGGAEILYSEDLQSGQQVGSVKILNPFDRRAVPDL
jgi:predicted nucleic acid-binding protein